MAAKKTPGRDIFDAKLAEIRSDIPPTYSPLVLAKIRKPATMARIKDPAVLVKLSNPRTAGHYFNQVMKGQTVDFVVLDALDEVAQEYRAAAVATV